MRCVVVAIAMCGMSRVAVADPNVAEPAGYRLENYRAPVPDTVAGGRVVHTDELNRLVAQHEVLLIDVLPAPRQPEGMKPGTPWLPLPRYDVPGSTWLPEVGRGALSAAADERFRSKLETLTGGDHAKPLVFYCLADCWMSWNATKRAVSYGFRNANWYPDGSDGWHAAGLPLQRSEPEPVE